MEDKEKDFLIVSKKDLNSLSKSLNRLMWFLGIILFILLGVFIWSILCQY